MYVDTPDLSYFLCVSGHQISCHVYGTTELELVPKALPVPALHDNTIHIWELTVTAAWDL